MLAWLSVLRIGYVALALALLPNDAFAQAGAPVWTNRYSRAEAGPDGATAMAVAKSGDIIVTGCSYGGRLTPDYATLAYSSAGVPLWTNLYDGSPYGTDEPVAVAVDNLGNVFVTGQSWWDYATLAYSSTGMPLWTNRHPVGSWGQAKAIACNTNGDVVVIGSARRGGGDVYETIEYSAAGVPLWTNSYSDIANSPSRATALALDSGGNVFVTGNAYSLEGAVNTYRNFATVAYSDAGEALWTNRYNGTGNSDDYPTAIAVDSSGTLFVTGYSAGDGTAYDYATVAYSCAGVPLWTNRYNAWANGDDKAYAVAVDNHDHVYVTGVTPGNDGGSDFLTLAYSSAGVPLWTNRYCGPPGRTNFPVAMAVDSQGNVFVTGISPASPAASMDYATVAYSCTGEPLWTNRYHGPDYSDDDVRALAVDERGNVYVTGQSSGTNGHTAYATIKYSSSESVGIHLDFRREDDRLLLSWTNANCWLQSAPAIQGTFTNIPGATSPYTNRMTAAAQYFRLMRE